MRCSSPPTCTRRTEDAAHTATRRRPRGTPTPPSEPPHETYVTVENLQQGLCAITRPHFFRGVATVVAKLFNIVEPDVAVFGKKDYQQWRVIQRMVRDLDFDIDVVGMPLAREPDGLAMSSRNVRLTPENRKAARPSTSLSEKSPPRHSTLDARRHHIRRRRRHRSLWGHG